MKAHFVHIRCWNCGYENNGTASAHDQVPVNEDVVICWRCGSLAIYDDTRNENARKPSPSEYDGMMQDKEIIQMVLFWQRYRNEAPPWMGSK